MEKFNILKGVPANLPMINVDTDMIIPKQFLKTLKRSGLGKSLFFEMRYDEQGKKKDNFVLNKEPYNKSSILLTGKNFGCGSSREHAPWALLDFGIKCIIGPSFADIFYNNCFKNSMLPIVLSQNNLEEIVEYSKRKEMVEINLTKQEIKFGNKIINFEIDPFKKECLLNGLDDISLSLEKSEKISSYEENLKKTKPWTN
jgi:3-isopropylmalate/(R)-2-methylmalate dehydratase small subunit